MSETIRKTAETTEISPGITQEPINYEMENPWRRRMLKIGAGVSLVAAGGALTFGIMRGVNNEATPNPTETSTEDIIDSDPTAEVQDLMVDPLAGVGHLGYDYRNFNNISYTSFEDLKAELELNEVEFGPGLAEGLTTLGNYQPTEVEYEQMARHYYKMLHPEATQDEAETIPEEYYHDGAMYFGKEYLAKLAEEIYSSDPDSRVVIHGDDKFWEFVGEQFSEIQGQIYTHRQDMDQYLTDGAPYMKTFEVKDDGYGYYDYDGMVNAELWTRAVWNSSVPGNGGLPEEYYLISVAGAAEEGESDEPYVTGIYDSHITILSQEDWINHLIEMGNQQN